MSVDVGMDSGADRLTLRQAAERLDTTPEAVRKRILRGSLTAEKVDGNWIVILPRQADTVDTSPDRMDGQRPVVVNIGTDVGVDAVRDMSGPLIDQLRDEIAHLRGMLSAREENDEVAFLRQQLETRDEEIRRRDHIIAGLVERVKELPSGAREPEPESDQSETATPTHSGWLSRLLGWVHRV